MGRRGLDTFSGKYDSQANKRRTLVKWPGYNNDPANGTIGVTDLTDECESF
jgi:hypothetical protein